MPRFGLPLADLPQRAFDAVEIAERNNGRTVLLRDGQPVAAIVPVGDLDKADPPDPGMGQQDPLLALCGTCKRDAFVDQVLYAFGAAPAAAPQPPPPVPSAPLPSSGLHDPAPAQPTFSGMLPAGSPNKTHFDAMLPPRPRGRWVHGMKGYLLDITALIEVLRSTPSRPFIHRLSTVPTSQRWTSSIVIGELLYSARRSNDSRVMTDVLKVTTAIRVAPFDTAAALVYGKLAASLAKAGTAISANDLLTASIARSLDFTLVTRRLHVFQVVPQLALEDWTR